MRQYLKYYKTVTDYQNDCFDRQIPCISLIDEETSTVSHEITNTIDLVFKGSGKLNTNNEIVACEFTDRESLIGYKLPDRQIIAEQVQGSPWEDVVFDLVDIDGEQVYVPVSPTMPYLTLFDGGVTLRSDVQLTDNDYFLLVMSMTGFVAAEPLPIGIGLSSNVLSTSDYKTFTIVAPSDAVIEPGMEEVSLNLAFVTPDELGNLVSTPAKTKTQILSSTPSGGLTEITIPTQAGLVAVVFTLEDIGEEGPMFVPTSPLIPGTEFILQPCSLSTNITLSDDGYLLMSQYYQGTLLGAGGGRIGDAIADGVLQTDDYQHFTLSLADLFGDLSVDTMSQIAVGLGFITAAEFETISEKAPETQTFTNSYEAIYGDTVPVTIKPSKTYTDYFANTNLIEYNGQNNVNKTIPDECFKACQYLTTVTLSNKVEKIGVGAFASCINLMDINLPNNLTIITESLMANCSSLHSISLPSTVQEIQSNAFAECVSLTSITFNSTIMPSIGESAFLNCPITTVYVPNACTNAYSELTNFIDSEFEIVELV